MKEETREQEGEQAQTWCDHCSADLNGVKHVLCERCYREYAGPTWFDPEFNAAATPSDTPVVARQVLVEHAQKIASLYGQQLSEAEIESIISKHFAATTSPSETAVGGEE